MPPLRTADAGVAPTDETPARSLVRLDLRDLRVLPEPIFSPPGLREPDLDTALHPALPLTTPAPPEVGKGAAVRPPVAPGQLSSHLVDDPVLALAALGVRNDLDPAALAELQLQASLANYRLSPGTDAAHRRLFEIDLPEVSLDLPLSSPTPSISPEQLSPFGTPDQTEFKRAVLRAHIAKLSGKGRNPSAGLADSELGPVEEGYRLRQDAAIQARALLTKARSDLRAAQAQGEPLARRAAYLGITSTYRDPQLDFRLWDRYFAGFYRKTEAERKKQPGGEHGPQAVQVMVEYYLPRKAPPGFSNHTNGIAVDFITRQDGRTLITDTGLNPLWVQSWFYKWLAQNAAAYGYKPLASEAWHWEYRGQPAASDIQAQP